ncbi:MAG: hypothetical protein P4L40_05325 [Terracidiphilus sp.]|nr:hypothetical protein [Terracidiphilus sp.]
MTSACVCLSLSLFRLCVWARSRSSVLGGCVGGGGCVCACDDALCV